MSVKKLVFKTAQLTKISVSMIKNEIEFEIDAGDCTYFI